MTRDEGKTRKSGRVVQGGIQVVLKTEEMRGLSLLRGGTHLQTKNREWIIALGNPRPLGSPLGRGNAKTIGIKMDLVATTTTKLLPVDVVQPAPRTTIPPIGFLTPPVTNPNEIGEMMTGIRTSARPLDLFTYHF